MFANSTNFAYCYIKKVSDLSAKLTQRWTKMEWMVWTQGRVLLRLRRENIKENFIMWLKKETRATSRCYGSWYETLAPDLNLINNKISSKNQSYVTVNICLIKFQISKSFSTYVPYNCIYLRHTTFRFYLIDFQLNTDSSSQLCVFYRKISYRGSKSKNLSPHKTKGSNNPFTLIENNFRLFKEGTAPLT